MELDSPSVISCICVFTKVFDFYYLSFLCHFIFLLLVSQTFTCVLNCKLIPMYMTVLSVCDTLLYVHSELCKKHTHSLHWTIVSVTCHTHRFPCSQSCSQWRHLWRCIWHTQKWAQPCAALYLFQTVHCDGLHSPIPVPSKPDLLYVDGDALVRHVLTAELQ